MWFYIFALWVAFVWVGAWITVALCGLRQALVFCVFFSFIVRHPLCLPQPLDCVDFLVFEFLVLSSFIVLPSFGLCCCLAFWGEGRCWLSGLVWVDLGGGVVIYTL